MLYRFIADVHLGKLARMMRLIGIDTIYNQSYMSAELAIISKAEERILLTRNATLVKMPTLITYYIDSNDWVVQLKDVVVHYALQNYLAPLSRCIQCNGLIKTVPKENIINDILPKTALYYKEFWQCDSCYKIYWKGAHFARIERLIKQVQEWPIINN